jgi:predicted RNA binding protein YcfA (HicA-like mRNA interferase family)
MKPREFLRKLRKAGVTVIKDKGKGSHVRLVLMGKKTTLPWHGDRDLGPKLMREICKQLGLDLEDIL